MIVKAKFADLRIDMDAMFPGMERFCKKYLAENESQDEAQADFSVSASLEEIEAEDDKLSGVHFPMNYLETLAVLRKIAEQFPYYQRFLMHGAVISFQEKAYMFTALSGTGKTTHIKLWKRFLREQVQIVNGDKPFLWVKEPEVSEDEMTFHSGKNKGDAEKPTNTGVFVYGSPWAGKENWHRNVSAPLHGICFLKRGTENRIRKIQPGECLPLLMKQVYLPADGMAAGLTLELLDQMLKCVPLYILECDMSEDAVKTSFEALTGQVFEKYKLSEEYEDCTYAD